MTERNAITVFSEDVHDALDALVEVLGIPVDELHRRPRQQQRGAGRRSRGERVLWRFHGAGVYVRVGKKLAVDFDFRWPYLESHLGVLRRLGRVDDVIFTDLAHEFLATDGRIRVRFDRSLLVRGNKLDALHELFNVAARSAEAGLSPSDFERDFATLVDFIRRHPTLRPAAVRRFVRCVASWDLSPELVAYCMHDLRFPEVLEALRAAVTATADVRRQAMLWDTIGSFDDDWKDAHMYERFRAKHLKVDNGGD